MISEPVDERQHVCTKAGWVRFDRSPGLVTLPSRPDWAQYVIGARTGGVSPI